MIIIMRAAAVPIYLILCIYNRTVNSLNIYFVNADIKYR